MKTSDVFSRMLDEAASEAKSTAHEVEILARLLAEKMHALHGDNYRIDISQQYGYVFVVKHNR